LEKVATMTEVTTLTKYHQVPCRRTSLPIPRAVPRGVGARLYSWLTALAW
jgi:hypothetical protein